LVATSENILIEKIMDMDTKSFKKNMTFESMLGELSAKLVNGLVTRLSFVLE
jgi:hypothetical protein